MPVKFSWCKEHVDIVVRWLILFPPEHPAGSEADVRDWQEFGGFRGIFEELRRCHLCPARKPAVSVCVFSVSGKSFQDFVTSHPKILAHITPQENPSGFPTNLIGNSHFNHKHTHRKWCFYEVFIGSFFFNGVWKMTFFKLFHVREPDVNFSSFLLFSSLSACPFRSSQESRVT